MLFNFADMFRGNTPSAPPSPLRATLGHMISGGPAMPTAGGIGSAFASLQKPPATGGLSGIGNALTGLQRPTATNVGGMQTKLSGILRGFSR